MKTIFTFTCLFATLIHQQVVGQGTEIPVSCGLRPTRSLEFESFTSANHVASGDFDSDGDLDLIAATHSGLFQFSNAGFGNFAEPTSIAVDQTYISTAAGNLNGDANLDLVAIAAYTSEDRRIAIFLNQGDGNLKLDAEYSIADYNPRDLIAVDLNADSKLDIVTSNQSQSSGNVTVLLNNGNGSFKVDAHYDLNTSFTVTMDYGDVDGDSAVDLVITIGGNLVILSNNGNGAFSQQPPIDFSSTVGFPLLGDFDFDGDLDLTVRVIGEGAGRILTAINDGSGSFIEQNSFDVGTAVITGIEFADLDGVQGLDLLVVDQGNVATSLLNCGDGSFRKHRSYGIGDDSNAASINVGDFDGDFDDDVVTANQNSGDLSLLLSDGGGGFAAVETYKVGDGAGQFASGDFDGDFDTDIVAANFDGISVLSNLGDGTFAEEITYKTPASPNAVTTLDVDGDLDIDVVTANRDDDSVTVLLNDGKAAFSIDANYKTGAGPSFLAAGDMDGDLDIDLITANKSCLSILLNNGDGSYAEHIMIAGGNEVTAVGDLDGDRDLDLVSRGIGGGITIHINDGSGQNFLQETIPDSASPFSIVVCDLDNDLDLDIASASLGGFGDNLLIFLNKGDASFTLGPIPTTVFPLGPLFSVAAADFDGDMDLDLIASDAIRRCVVLRNNGEDQFTEEARFSVGSVPMAIATLDVDNDLDVDIAVSDRIGDHIWILRNECTLLGDINLDQQVDLLDIAPFVSLIVSGVFEAEADINQDGALNLLDVGPFVVLLTGP